MFDVPTSYAYDLVSTLTESVGAVAAIILFTLAVRLLLMPLSVAAARGQRARSRLLPQVQKLQKRHRKDPGRAQREIAALYAAEGVSPAAGCLPALVQAPFFFVMYRLFVSATIAGHQNVLLAQTLLGTPLGQNWIGLLGSGAVLSPASLVFLGLFGLLACVAWISTRLIPPAPEGTPGGRILRLLPYGTVIVAAFVPLAAGLYLLVSTAWTAGERAVLRPAAAR